MSFGTVDKSLLASSLLDHGPLPVAMMFLIVAEKDKYGVTTLNPRIMSKLLRIPLELAQEGWRVLTSPDPESSNPEHEGRRLIPHGDGKWLVVSHAKYQAEHSLARKREQDAQAQQRHRDRLKALAKSGEVCSVCGGGPVEGAVAGEFRCRAHWPEDPAALVKCDGNHARSVRCLDPQCWQTIEEPPVEDDEGPI